jgi:hypothetical protein
VYPPAWQALGVDLSKLYFARSKQPCVELKPLFLEALFSVIILDHATLKTADFAFLASRARYNQQVIFIIQNRKLQQAKASVKVRMNSYYQHGKHHIDLLKPQIKQLDIT